MAPRIAWLLNLDAELELRAPARYRPHAAMQLRITALIPALKTLVAPCDVILLACGTERIDLVAHDTPERFSSADTTDVIALAFSATEHACATLRARGYRPPAAPPNTILSRLARRSFAAGLGQTLPGAAYVTDLDTLRVLLGQSAPCPTGTWLLKRDFSFAGRERMRVPPGALSEHTQGFAQRSFARGEGLQVEPWCERLLDVAQHGYLQHDGTLLLAEPMLQRCDARGVWQESLPLPADALLESERDALAHATRSAGEALRAAGYFGPFGVDAFRYQESAERTAFQPRCEINARFTMGYPRALLLAALAHSPNSHGAGK